MISNYTHIPRHLYYSITNVQSKFYNGITMVLWFVLKKKHMVQKHSTAIKHVQKKQPKTLKTQD